MCSILGVKTNNLYEKIDNKNLNYANNLLAHRGPDSQNFYRDPNIFLAHNRLSIIDIKNGSQPIFSKCKKKTCGTEVGAIIIRRLIHEFESRFHYLLSTMTILSLTAAERNGNAGPLEFWN